MVAKETEYRPNKGEARVELTGCDELGEEAVSRVNVFRL